MMQQRMHVEHEITGVAPNSATSNQLGVIVNSKKKEEHKHTLEEERRIREAALDETLEGTFPASDPPSTIPDPDNDEALERYGT